MRNKAKKLEIFTGYFADEEGKSKKFLMNYVDYFFRETMKYDKKYAMSQTEIHGFEL